MADLRLQVILTALDKITGPLKKIRDAAAPTSKAMKEVSDKLSGLNGQLKETNYLRKLQQDFRSTSVELKKSKLALNDVRDAYEDQRSAQHKLASQTKTVKTEFKGLQRELMRTKEPSAQLTASFALARDNLLTVERAYDRSKSKLRGLSRSLKDAELDTKKLTESKRKLFDTLGVTRQRFDATGISVSKFRQHEKGLREDVEATTKQLDIQKAKLTALSKAKQHTEKMRGVAGNMAMAGAGATMAGAAIGAPIVKGMNEAKHYQVEKNRINALGLNKAESQDAINFAKNMKTYGTSHLENLELVRDGMTAFADVNEAKMVVPMLAKMKFGNKAFYGEEAGAENDRKFMDMLKVIELRGGLHSQKDFENQANIVQQVITATGGRVGPNEWLNMIKTGGVAAKGLDDKAFYYQMEPLVQEMGGFRVGTAMMSAYSSLYQGRTTKRAAKNLDAMGLIGDQSKVTHDKSGQLSFLNPGALLGSDLFRTNQFEWMEKIMLPQLEKKGIKEKEQVLDAIGGMFSNRTASNLFAQMYLQREQIHKNAKLNAGADNIDQISQKAQGMAAGQEVEATSKLADLKLAMGEKILPIYTDALISVTEAIKNMNSFMEKNPATAKVMIISFGVLAAILVVLGPLMLMLAALIGPYAMLHILFAKMGIAGGVLTPILRGLGAAIAFVGGALKTAFLFFFTNPIGLTILAIVAAIAALAGIAYLVYKNWEPIKLFFGGLWDQIKQAFNGGIFGVGALIINWSPMGLFYTAFSDVMSWFGIEMPAKFTEFGANLLSGMANGITSRLGMVKDAIMGAGESVVGWFKEKLGIRSPSRIFAELGDFTMQGLAVGLQRREDAPLGTVGNMAKRLAQLGAGIAISTAAMPTMAFDTRPPIAARATNTQAMAGDTIQITINAAPGMDGQAIARAVSVELDRRANEKRSRARSSLSDYQGSLS